jgi:hypothetical protein
MSLSCHPCIDTSEHKSLGGLSPHHVEERTNTKKGIIKKHAKLQYWKDTMLIKINGYAKPTKHQLEEYIEYDGMNKDEVNPNEKHQ